MEKSFGELCTKLADLRGSFRAVQVAAAHDEDLTLEVKELLLALDSVLAAAQKARNAARMPVDVDAVRRTLPRCQRELNSLKAQFCVGLGAPARLEAYRTGGHLELAWHIGRCSGPLFAAEWALSVCWNRFGEYSVAHPGGTVPGLPPLRG